MQQPCATVYSQPAEACNHPAPFLLNYSRQDVRVPLHPLPSFVCHHVDCKSNYLSLFLVQVGLKVADLQEQSAAHRKQLADATREFKRSTASAASEADAEYVKAVAGLLKRYQEEIDSLTRRAKHGGRQCYTVLGCVVLCAVHCAA